ncbi:MAG: recombinase family protein, partial [Pseudonocardiaceae bacterium]
MSAPSTARPLVVDLYARLSRCPTDGSLEKVDTQLVDCRAVAQRNGWTIGHEHDDPNLSAWRRGVRRPGWEALLGRLESGACDGVVVWHTDRLLRQPRDLERLIDLGDGRGLVLASAYGEHNLGEADHRLALRILAATACKSSDDTSRRLKRRFATMREAGTVQGR